MVAPDASMPVLPLELPLLEVLELELDALELELLVPLELLLLAVEELLAAELELLVPLELLVELLLAVEELDALLEDSVVPAPEDDTLLLVAVAVAAPRVVLPLEEPAVSLPPQAQSANVTKSAADRRFTRASRQEA